MTAGHHRSAELSWCECETLCGNGLCPVPVLCRKAVIWLGVYNITLVFNCLDIWEQAISTRMPSSSISSQTHNVTLCACSHAVSRKLGIWFEIYNMSLAFNCFSLWEQARGCLLLL